MPHQRQSYIYLTPFLTLFWQPKIYVTAIVNYALNLNLFIQQNLRFFMIQHPTHLL